MTRDTPIDRIRSARGGTSGTETMGDLGRQVGSAYDHAAGAAQQAYVEARDVYHDALQAAEDAYAEARAAAEETYHEAEKQADALMAQASHLYDEAASRSRAYGKRVARFTGDNKALALLLAGGMGYLVAKATRGHASR